MNTRNESTRRSILLNGVRLSALGALAPRLGAAPAHSVQQRAEAKAGSSPDENVLVVLQLTGGNDGLNTVAPYAQDEYYKLRPTLAHKASDAHVLDDAVALHPFLGGLAGLYLSLIHI